MHSAERRYFPTCRESKKRRAPDGGTSSLGKLMLGAGLLAALELGRCMAAGPDITTLYSFKGSGSSDGSGPQLLSAADDGNLYGATSSGGVNGYGTLFKLTPDGQLTTVVSFTGLRGSGAPNYRSMIQAADGNLYGTTQGGGPATFGTIYQLTPAGAFSTVYSFGLDVTNVYAPNAGLGPVSLLQGKDGNFYGTTYNGGAYTNAPTGFGTVFKLTPDGVYSTLFSFNGVTGGQPNSLVQGSDGNFYGTTTFGSPNYDDKTNSGDGIVFKLSPGGDYTLLAYFNKTNGSQPSGPLVEGKDGSFYGTTLNGRGTAAYGTIFRVTPAGDLTTLVSFNNTNGAYPQGGMVLAGDANFYGTTYTGTGPTIEGTIFRLAPSGVLTTIFSFGYTNGSGPGALTLDRAGNIYGLTYGGGGNGAGTAFRLNLFTPAPVFRVPSLSGDQLLLTWSAVPGVTYQIQSKTNLEQSSWDVLGSVTASASLAGTNLALPAAQMFFRLTTD